MTAIVCFDLIIGAVKTGTHVYIVSLGVIVGCLVVYLLNLIIDKSTNHEVVHIDLAHPKTADDLDEIIHSNHLISPPIIYINVSQQNTHCNKKKKWLYIINM